VPVLPVVFTHRAPSVGLYAMEERVAGCVLRGQHVAHLFEAGPVRQEAIAVQGNPLTRILVSMLLDPGELRAPRAGLDARTTRTLAGAKMLATASWAAWAMAATV
jgi:hypothetical protein